MWLFTTPGAKSADLTMNAKREPSDPLDRDAVATMSYADMRLDGAKQIFERIQLDL